MREDALKGAAKRTREERSEAARNAQAARSPEARREASRKGAEARRRKREAAEGAGGARES
jgi:hypothetical protein